MTTRRMAKRALENETSVVSESNPIRLIIEEFIEPLRRNKIARFVDVMEESEEKREMYEVDIDFDGASEAWRSNKKSFGNGHYKYVCEGFTKTGKKCVREPSAGCAFCKIHTHTINKK